MKKRWSSVIPTLLNDMFFRQFFEWEKGFYGLKCKERTSFYNVGKRREFIFHTFKFTWTTGLPKKFIFTNSIPLFSSADNQMQLELVDTEIYSIFLFRVPKSLLVMYQVGINGISFQSGIIKDQINLYREYFVRNSSCFVC